MKLHYRALIGVAFTLSTLASFPAGATSHQLEREDMGDLVYRAAQKMVDHLPRYVARDHAIIVTTMVSVDDLSRSSTFGRESSQLILNKLAQNSYLVKDVTYMLALDINPATGEMVLSRDASKISREFNAQAVVVGTYAVGGEEIYLNIRMLDAISGSVISTADVAIPVDRDTAPLVAESHAEAVALLRR